MRQPLPLGLGVRQPSVSLVEIFWMMRRQDKRLIPLSASLTAGGCGGESRQTARPTQALAPAPRGRRPSRCVLETGSLRAERRAKRSRETTTTRTGGGSRTRPDNNDGPARDNDSHLDVRMSSAHAECRASATRRRSAWASAPSRPPRFEGALRAAAGRRGLQPVLTYRVAVDGRGRMGRVRTTRPR